MESIKRISAFLDVPAGIVKKYPGISLKALGEQYYTGEEVLVELYNKEKRITMLGKLH